MKKPKSGTRPQRVNRIARALAQRWERQRFLSGGRKKPLCRREPKPRDKVTIAYDLETSRIAAGTPQCKFITAYGELKDGAGFQICMPVSSLAHLREILIARFLIPELAGARFVAWNGNNFDAYFIVAAMLTDRSYVIRPYLTRNKAMRGLRIAERKPRQGTKNKKPLAWEFLDAMAMVGAHAWPDKRLKFFLERFAPDYGKLAGPDWEREEFDPMNADHVRYAFRDSEGLYRGMKAAQGIVKEHFGVPLYPTIGNTGIRIFSRNMPITTQVWEPPLTALTVIRDFVMRGGYCHLVRPYFGPIWKYDLNQAYAAAMRETLLPAGSCTWTSCFHPYAKVAVYQIRARNVRGRIPFYYKNWEKLSRFDPAQIETTWVTSIELEQLKREGWRVEVLQGFFWDETFTMSEYVNKLERLRQSAPGGPNSAQGLMVKAIGNNSYGKTVETLDGLELVMSAEKPEGFSEYQGDDDLFQHIWFKFEKPMLREYHQPQIGAFITAHVRMVVRRAALLDPSTWLYADTDCVVFSKPQALDCHPSQYGKWKEEVAGKNYILIDKKVYADETATVKHAKGMNVNRLTQTDFLEWFNGRAPEQTQIQRQNFVRVMTGKEMFIERSKFGTAQDRAPARA